jgi:hypothetical protein
MIVASPLRKSLTFGQNANTTLQRLLLCNKNVFTVTFRPSLPIILRWLPRRLTAQHDNRLTIMSNSSCPPSSPTDTNLKADDALRNTPALLVTHY